MLVEEMASDLEETLDYFGMLEILKNHYGDGLVYLPEGASTELLGLAKEHDYVNDEGYLTREGRMLLTQHRSKKNLS